ncbi:lipopolysaccharide biosynthesis protein [Geodermatophilus poikilotrophus]|uniref:Polysaccharide transporter, PST family n=1 Tax=Geodermatophilus poikilotrophus TaxID=1333667 RepID=A0A1I0FC49_9ACTN|nr:lipopolysaccharide biosynthesis protein [Geodermatophilus poikilotrophus]SET55102.1 polysaccharide transporter, PST family [Geodermatophilus poikilotrophus]
MSPITRGGPSAQGGPEPDTTVAEAVDAAEAPARVDARTAGSSFLWSAASFGSSKLLVFLTTLVMARLLVPEDFGVVAVGLAIVSFLEVALDLGVGSALVYEQERGITRRVQTAFTLNVAIASACTAAGVLAGPLVARVFDVQDTTLLQVLFLYFLLRGLVQVPDAVLRRDLAFRRRALIEVARAVVRGVVSIALAATGAGAWALVAGILASEAVGVVLTWVAVRFVPVLAFDRSAARALLGFGTAVLSLKVLGAVSENADYFIIGAQLGTAALGIYTLGYRIPEIVLANVFWIFSSVAFSIYARARSEDLQELRTAVLRAMRIITLFAFPTGVGIAVVSTSLTPTLLGPGWEAAAAPMAFIALSMAASSIGYASGDVFPAVGRPGLLIKIVAPTTAVKVVGLLLAAPYGLTAMAATACGLSAVFATIRLLVVDRLLGLRLTTSLEAMSPGLVAAAGAALGALPVVLLRPTGVVTLVGAVAAGVLGAVALLVLLRRAALRDLWQLIGAMRPRRSGDAAAGAR